MKLKNMYKGFKKLLPFTATETESPLHCGEVYFLWETLTSSYLLMTLVETYLMNTEDKELHLLLQGIVAGAFVIRINRLEKILKDEGFTVPPQPSSKTLQGKPGAGQEVKLTDDEVLQDLVAWGQVLMQQDVRAIGAATRESVRKVFTDLIYDDMKAYNALINMGKSRQIFNPPPPATARDNSLNMGEVAVLWDQVGARHISLINLETFMANSKDPELMDLMKIGLNKVVLPQLRQLENMLKQEGFTIPARPIRRIKQMPPGDTNKIVLSDHEVIRLLISAMQVAVDHHIKSFTVCMREDIRDMFSDFLSTEIEFFQKVMDIAAKRSAFSNPPVVTSKRG